ncbi:MAG: hypothetical protein DCC65_07680 [Planctomycetota bacterium]|nr:MAG: hypothetical protein DCC65_07680 [Planctomycetota bacterium]
MCGLAEGRFFKGPIGSNSTMNIRGRRRVNMSRCRFAVAFCAFLILCPLSTLAGTPCPELVISEFMAKNVRGLKDADGTFQDWIEIHNPCTSSVDLDGWYLTDDAGNPTKWRFPSVQIVRGDFLVVFASGKNLATAGQELHTNFELNTDGEYLALIRPDGVTVAHEFSPRYPEQFLDVSFGSPQSVENLVDIGDSGTFHVPTLDDAALGTDWTAGTFDDAAWTVGESGFGFLASTNTQFDVTYFKANIAVSSLAIAESVISNPSNQTSVVTASAPVINYLNTGGTARFGSDSPFPGTTIGTNVDDFVLLVTGSVVIPSPGDWTFGVNSDDGFSLELTNGPTNFFMSFPNPRGPADTLSVFNVTEPGSYNVRLVFYERGGGAEVELFAAAGSHGAFNSNFKLVGDTANGGLSVVGFGGDVRTDVQPEMHNVNSSFWTRLPFTMGDPSGVTSLLLRARYEDGFVAYLNGQEVARRNAPPSITWSSAADSDRPLNLAFFNETIDLGASIPLLANGSNVLSVHGLNDSAADNEFLMVPRLLSIEGEIDPDVRQYFTTPTPATFNNQGYPAFAGSVQYSTPNGLFVDPFSVSISTGSPTAIIRYTLDGTVPTETNGLLYSAPLAVSATTRIRARAFETGLAPGPVSSRVYTRMDSALTSFSSDLPVVVVENFGGGIPPQDDKQTAHVSIFTPDTSGRTWLTQPAVVSVRAGINVRGSSTAGQPKPNLAVEARDEDDEDRDVAVLGMPADSDWILYAPYHFDRALIRNAFVFALSNEIGRYAVRTRFVEVYLNANGGDLSNSDYYGVYVLMEKIKRGADRVNIEELEPHHHAEPEISGGWMLKIDRADPGDVGFSAAGQTLRYVEPKEYEVVDQQATWIKAYLDAFGAALNGPDFANPVTGYALYINPDSWIDHHIINTMTKNVDALRLSTYMFKDRGLRLEMGPVWDFDRSMDSYDGRDDATNTWSGTGDATQVFSYTWWNRLFLDPDFMQKWIDRWHELRQDALSVAGMHAIIDGMAAELAEAQARNFAAWPSVAPSGGVYQNEIDHLKQWVADRVAWIDTQFTTAPVFNHSPGLISYGFELTLAAPAGTIYYTLDHSDPRMPGGGIAPSALVYSGPIEVTADTHVRARALVATNWSAPADAQFILGFAENPNVVINELMYNPAGGSAAEFLELRNLSSTEAVDLAGWQITGISYTFPGAAILPPGAHAVVVEDLAVFQATYGNGIHVLGDYAGALDNGGETIRLLDADNLEIDRVSYDDALPWPTTPDGLGPSLELIDAAQDNNRVANWAASASAGGTPGQPNSQAGLLPPLPNLVINELLSRNQSIIADESSEFEPWIEIYNAGDSTASLDGMYLTSNYALPFMWQFPAGTDLCAGEWLLVWADGEPADGPLHANFTLSLSAGSLGLYTSAGLVLDYANYPALAPNIAYGRYADGAATRYQLPVPTPGAANAPGTTRIILNEYNGVSSSRILKDNGSDTYWGQVVGNGGDWFEIVVIEDHLDVRGWDLVVSDKTGLSTQEIDILTFTSEPIWSDLRSGTIITVSEDLADDVSYDPAAGDWWINVWANNSGTGTYITADNFAVSNDNWQLTIRDQNDAVVFGPAGEGVQPASGIGNDEVCKLEEDPNAFVTRFSNYQDGVSSSFGSPNIYSGGTMVQDFSSLRSALQPCEAAETCEDGNPCTFDDCVGGECTHEPIGPCYELRINGPSATGPQIDACVQGTLVLTLDASGLQQPVNGVQALLQYDPSRLLLVSAIPGDGAGSPWDAATPLILTDDNGAVTYALAILGNSTTQAATVATLTFSVLPAPFGAPPSVVDLVPGCAPIRTKLTTASNETILPSLVSSSPIVTAGCVAATIIVPGLVGTAGEGGLVAQRTVEFLWTTCPETTDARSIPVAFHRSGGDGIGQVLLTGVNPATTWLSVREGHTLHSRVPVDVSSGADAVSVTLRSGDFQTTGTPQDGLVDILDFAILAVRWNTPVTDCTELPPQDCSFGADATGDGHQSTADFTALQMNYFQMGDSAHDCLPPLPLGPPPGSARPAIETGHHQAAAVDLEPLMGNSPRRSVRVSERPALQHSIGQADLNADGLIDAADVRTFARSRNLVISPEFDRKLRDTAATATISNTPPTRR